MTTTDISVSRVQEALSASWVEVFEPMAPR